MALFCLLGSLALLDPTYAQLAQTASPTYKVNNKRTGQSTVITNISKPYLKWKFNAGAGIESSPAFAADGTVYFGTNEDNFYALNPDGTVKWVFSRENHEFGSSPSVDKNSVVYIGATRGMGMRFSEHIDKEVSFGTMLLYAINPDGTLKWEFLVGGIAGGFTWGATLGEDGTIYMISGAEKKEGNEGGGNRFWAINPDGTEKWSFHVGQEIISAGAIADDGTIYFGCADGNLYALTPEGKEKWRYSTGPDAETKDSLFDTVPMIGTDGTIYIGNRDHHLYAFTPEGKVKWTFSVGGPLEAPASLARNGNIYSGVIDINYFDEKTFDKNLYAISPAGKEVWRFETDGGITATPVTDANDILYFGSYDGYLYSLNPDGTQRWKYKAREGIVASPSIGTDGTIYVGSWDGFLYAIDGIEREQLAYCGDNICEEGETKSCSQDCGESMCGDGVCQKDEEKDCHDDCGTITKVYGRGTTSLLVIMGIAITAALAVGIVIGYKKKGKRFVLPKIFTKKPSSVDDPKDNPQSTENPR
ncbi:MAG: PQQ-binding-like beta-propeller repeat protein [bacterium]